MSKRYEFNPLTAELQLVAEPSGGGGGGVGSLQDVLNVGNMVTNTNIDMTGSSSMNLSNASITGRLNAADLRLIRSSGNVGSIFRPGEILAGVNVQSLGMGLHAALYGNGGASGRLELGASNGAIASISNSGGSTATLVTPSTTGAEIIATREWVAANSGGGGGGAVPTLAQVLAQGNTAAASIELEGWAFQTSVPGGNTMRLDVNSLYMFDSTNVSDLGVGSLGMSDGNSNSVAINSIGAPSVVLSAKQQDGFGNDVIVSTIIDMFNISLSNGTEGGVSIGPEFVTVKTGEAGDGTIGITDYWGKTVRFDKREDSFAGRLTMEVMANNASETIATRQWMSAAGPSSSRPTNSPAGNRLAGRMYFDTTLNKPIWYTGSAWVDATGATV